MPLMFAEKFHPRLSAKPAGEINLSSKNSSPKNISMSKNFFKALLLSVSIAGIISTNSCGKDGLNLFTIDDDKTLGAQIEGEIANNPSEYPILNSSAYASAYAYVEMLKQQILNSGQMEHANDFVWKVYIVQDDAVQNAFCTPGGYIYVYTGLIKYLDNASSLAGVLGHEMAHADRRHSTQMLTQQYGLSMLLDVVLGNNQNQLTDIAANLSVLAFSRQHESDADAHSVIFLCPTNYRADGAADFFEKIVASGAQQPPAFLSTHPNPDNRITNIHSKKTELGCSNIPSTQVETADYTAFKNMLP